MINRIHLRKKSHGPIQQLPDIPYRRVDARFRMVALGEEHGMEISDNLVITNIQPKADCNREVIPGDRIQKINGVVPKNRAHALNMLGQPNLTDVRLEVMRRQHTSPLSADRAKRIQLQRMDGFSYFVVTCIKDGRDPVASFGFTLKLLKNRAHVILLDPKGVASVYFCLGDALLDLDGVPVPFNDIEFVRGYAQKFNKVGKFSVVVERPVSNEALYLYNMLFKCILPQESDVEMGQDAVMIGKEAAMMHRCVLAKLKPKGVISKSGESKDSDVATMKTCDKSESGKKVKIAQTILESRIASDVEDDDDLKSVERRSTQSGSSKGFVDDFF